MPNANDLPVSCRNTNHAPPSGGLDGNVSYEVLKYTYSMTMYTYLSNSLKLEHPSDLPKTVARYSAIRVR